MGWIRGQDLWIRTGREPCGEVFVIRKALGNAVVRNRLRRRLRHILRDMDTPVSGSLVILARPSVMVRSFAVVQDQVHDLLRRQRACLDSVSTSSISNC